MTKIIIRRMRDMAVLSSIFLQPGIAMEASESSKAAPLPLQSMILEKPAAFKSKADEIEAADLGNLLEGNGLNLKTYPDTEKSMFKTLLLDATAGNLQAQVDLAKAYQQGNLVAQNLNKAILWYHRAAEKNHPEAQYMLGKFYYKGLGGEVNLKEAISWYQQAADQGHTSAQYYLGFLYHKGYGVKLDLKEAVGYYVLSNTLKANKGLHKILGPLQDRGGSNEHQFLKDINYVTGLAEYFIAKNGLKAELNRPGFGVGRIDNPDQAAFHQSLVDFGIAVLRVLKSFNEPGFMVSFKNVPKNHLYASPNGSPFFRIYPFLSNLACMSKEAVSSGDLLYKLLDPELLLTPENYKYVHKKIRKAIEVEKKALKDFKAKIVKLDKLIQVIKETSSEGTQIQQQEILQEAERVGISGENIKPSFIESALQEIIEVRPKKLIHYLSEKVLYKKALDKCSSSLRFLNKQLVILEKIKDGLFKLLRDCIYLRNKKLVSIRPGFPSK